MIIDQPAAATLRFAKIVKSHPAHHGYDVVFLDDGSIAAGVQKLSAHASNNAGTVDMQTVDRNEDDPWSAEMQSPKDQTKRDITAVIAMVGVTPVVVGTLPPAVSQMNFPDSEDYENLHIERHASDMVQSTDKNGNWNLAHPGGGFISFSETGIPPDFEGKDYDKVWKLSKNLDKAACINISVKAVSGNGGAYILLQPGGDININASGNINGSAGKDIILSATKIYLN